MFAAMSVVRGHVLGITSDDYVLSRIGPVGLGLAAGSALIVDLLGEMSGRTLAEIRDDGPRLAELSPGRTGVARISAGPVLASELEQVVATLASSWPAIVVSTDGSRWSGPTVTYRPFYPGPDGPNAILPSVWQVAPGARPSKLPGVVMPSVSRRAMVAMLRGGLPVSRRWVSAWRKVWALPWA